MVCKHIWTSNVNASPCPVTVEPCRDCLLSGRRAAQVREVAARRDIHPLDRVAFAKGTEADPPSRFNGPDIVEPDDGA